MTAANSITVTALDVITAALQEIGVLAGGEQPSNEDAAWTLQKLQRLIDRYNARLPMVYDEDFFRFTLQANHNPHTIGPGCDFDINQRPVDIPYASLILAGTEEVEVRLNKRDGDWWASQTIKSLTSTLPTDYYYSRDWPQGEIWFWPVPAAVNDVRLGLRIVLGQITSFAQTFSMPPAYWDAIVYPLAISLCPSFERSASPELVRLSAEALKAIQVNNVRSPRLRSDAPSQTSTERSRPDFSFLTGMRR